MFHLRGVQWQCGGGCTAIEGSEVLEEEEWGTPMVTGRDGHFTWKCLHSVVQPFKYPFPSVLLGDAPLQK